MDRVAALNGAGAEERIEHHHRGGHLGAVGWQLAAGDFVAVTDREQMAALVSVWGRAINDFRLVTVSARLDCLLRSNGMPIASRYSLSRRTDSR